MERLITLSRQADTSKARGCCVTVLVDNRAMAGLVSEHGLSLWVEVGNLRVLFDTGQSTQCIENVKELGVPIKNADALVISHGHYDHAGAVAEVLQEARGAQVFLHPHATRTRFSVCEECVKDLSMPVPSQRALRELGAERLHEVTGPCELVPGVGVTGPIPRQTAYEDRGGPFFYDCSGTLVDEVLDEQALWVRVDAGVVICCGCCHAGVVNTVRYVRELSGEDRVAAVIGGLHLREASSARIKATLKGLEELGVQRIVACHCTGEEAVRALRARWPERVIEGYAGLRLAIGVDT